MSSSSTASNTTAGGRPGAPQTARAPGAQRQAAAQGPGAQRQTGPARGPGVSAGQRPAARPGVAATGAEGPARGPAAQRPAAPEPVDDGAPRQVRLTVGHVNAWTVLRLSFLLSVALGVVLVVVVALMWSVLDGIGVFTSLNGVIRDVVGSESRFDLMSYVGLSKVLSLTVLVAVVDVVLLTVLSTLGAVLYNICSALVGGVRLTLTDD